MDFKFEYESQGITDIGFPVSLDGMVTWKQVPDDCNKQRLFLLGLRSALESLWRENIEVGVHSDMSEITIKIKNIQILSP
jgi:hypothetical protein